MHLEAPVDRAIRARARGRGSAAPPSTGRQAVITGAAEGIGRALAEAFGAQGYAVTGVDINAALAAQTEAELAGRGVSIRFVQADLSQPAGVARLAAGKLAPGGSLVFISSLSRLLSYPGAAVYAASKHGLASYARSLGVALAPQDIHVLTVYPGPTRTAHARRYSPDNSREARRMAPDVVAAAVVRAVQRRRRVLVPGTGNQVFAGVGRWWPQIGQWAMRKTIWEKLEKVWGPLRDVLAERKQSSEDLGRA